MLADYKFNKYLKIKKSIDLIRIKRENTESKEMFKLIVVMVIEYKDIDKDISYSFSQIINLLTKAREGASRTHLALNLGFRNIIDLYYI